MSLDGIRTMMPRLKRARVERVTLTGGEPFVHPDILEICTAVRDAGVALGICTNATCISDVQIDHLVKLGGVHVNVSFDGFAAKSHGRFRGSPASFDVTVETACRLAAAGLLQGILSTPNALAAPDEFGALSEFAREQGASYLLMNPLSSFGRGVRSHHRLAATDSQMDAVRIAAVDAAGDVLEVVPIRFPNGHAPLAGCIAGSIFYVFADGATAVCPYLVFAARAPGSRYPDSEFLIGNVLTGEIAEALDAYKFHERYAVGANPTCGSCALKAECGKGCPAAIIAAGGSIGDRDAEACPFP
jgi:radical SAM protein with 4Fe4S-binding SPASM domain